MTDVVNTGEIRLEEDGFEDILFFDVDDHVDLGFLMDTEDGPHSSSSSSSSPAPQPAMSIGEIEKILLNDEVHVDESQETGAAADDFFAGIFLDSPAPSSTISSDNQPSPEIGSLQQPQPLSDEEAAKDSSGSEPSHSPSPEEAEEEEDKDDDPQTKKRKRQMRNRDAAVRSRERKKMYVKDLEAKSRYFESECRRLGMVLQCVMAENHSLRLAMYNNQATFGASSTRQESAVLFMESLLLGSLLWLVGVMGLLLLLPGKLVEVAAARPGRNQGLEGLRKEAQAPSKAMELESYMMSKGCRGSRRKMRMMPAVILLRSILV